MKQTGMKIKIQNLKTQHGNRAHRVVNVCERAVDGSR